MPLFFTSDREIYILICVLFWTLVAFLFYLDRGKK